jgi:phosphate/sulfate permease
VAQRIVIAWIVTMPAAGTIAALLYWLAEFATQWAARIF